MIYSNMDYAKIENEIIDKIIRKSNVELLHFLEIDVRDTKEAEEFILRFKYNIISKGACHSYW